MNKKRGRGESSAYDPLGFTFKIEFLVLSRVGLLPKSSKPSISCFFFFYTPSKVFIIKSRSSSCSTQQTLIEILLKFPSSLPRVSIFHRKFSVVYKTVFSLQCTSFCKSFAVYTKLFMHLFESKRTIRKAIISFIITQYSCGNFFKFLS